MLDVHPPHESAHSLGDFLLHILTITIGLFIALTLESFVEWRHHVHLVHEARETLRSEIEHNLHRLESDLPTLDRERAEMERNLTTLRVVQEHPAAPQHDMNLGIDFGSQTLDETAWKTAQSTGALGYMPYAEAQRYADVYGSQADLQRAEEKVLEDIARFQGLVARYNLYGNATVSLEAANALAEACGMLRTHVVYVHIAAQSALSQDKALLGGKPVPDSFSEKLN